MPFRKGMSAKQVIVGLAELHEEISTLAFAKYRVYPNVEQRVDKGGTDLEKTLLRKAHAMVARSGIPFWVGVLTAYAQSPGISSTLIREVLRHDKRYDDEFEIASKELTTDLLDQIACQLRAGFVVAVCSKVRMHDGQQAHIPLVDFRCEPSAQNIRKVRHALKRIGQRRGVLLNSGRSFHYYGLEILTEDAWRVFLGKCLLLSPMIDPRYIAHRLIDGYCRLRITATSEKPKVPEVVGLIEG